MVSDPWRLSFSLLEYCRVLDLFPSSIKHVHRKMPSMTLTPVGRRSLVLLFLLFFVSVSHASDCLPGSRIVYSPFQPYSNSIFRERTNSTNNEYSCWWWASCTYSEADESRKQQFAATSLVMGLVPLTLKDVAWPERRIVSITHSLPKSIEVLVRALGVVPSIAKSALDRHDAISSSPIYKWTLDKSRLGIFTLIALSTLGLLISYAAIALAEIYSKRSAFGCPYPVFILTWHLIALIPAIVETAPWRFWRKQRKVPIISRSASGMEILSRSAQERANHIEEQRRAVQTQRSVKAPQQLRRLDAEPDKVPPSIPALDADQIEAIVERRERNDFDRGEISRTPTFPLEDASPVQGRGKPWLIQMAWAVYYVAGTLVYSSIMAVTVIELLSWVVFSVAASVVGKFLAFFLCMLNEKRNYVGGEMHHD